MINERVLTEAGYKKHKSGASFPHSDFFYQKRFDGEKGIKYFIEFVHYAAEFIGQSELREGWTLHWNNSEPWYSFEAHRVNEGNLAALELIVDRIWVGLKCEYYEKYNAEITEAHSSGLSGEHHVVLDAIQEASLGG